MSTDLGKKRTLVSIIAAALIVLATLGVVQAAPSANVTTGLVGYWTFDELTGQIASDTSGNNNDAVLGSLSGSDPADPTWTLGKIGGALDFDGSNDFANAGDNPEFQLPVYSYSAWVNADNIPGTSKLSQILSNADQQFVLSWDHANANFVTSGAHKFVGTYNRAQIASPLLANTWYHLAVTYDGQNIRIYLDGVLEAVFFSGPPNAVSGNLYFGSGIGPSVFFDGRIDEVRIYDRALSDVEVQDIFNFDGTENNAAPNLDPIADQQVDAGDTLNVPLSAIDPDFDNMTLIAPYLPDFATLNDNGDGTGTITVTPEINDVGTHSVTVFVKDTAGLADSEEFEITVIDATDITTGLIGYWTFDDETGQTAADSSGLGHDGILGATSAQGPDDPAWVTGLVGGALRYDGAQDHVRVIDDPDFVLPVYSYSLWVNGDNAPGSTAFRQVISNANQQFTFSWDHPNPDYVTAASHQSGQDFPGSQLSSTLQSGVWYHVVATYDGSFLRVYLNGMLENTIAATPPNIASGDLFFGAASGVSGHFAGVIDEVRVYDRALNSQEVQKVYQLGGTASTIEGLVGYWPFDDMTGQIASDLSGNNHDGLLGLSAASGSDDPQWVAGLIGGALTFDGVNDFVRVIDDPDFALPNYTASIWLNGNSAPGTTKISQPLSNADQQFVLSWDHTKAAFVASGTHRSGSSYVSSQVTTPLQAGTWYHFVVSYDGSLINIYLNGVLQSSVPSGPPNTVGGDLTIGSSVGPSFFFAGVIDEVRFYDRALNSVEIQQLFQFGGASSGNNRPVVDPIANQQVAEDNTLIVPLSASDPDAGDTLTLTSPNLPSFGSLIDNGDGTGSITFTPGAGDSDTYPITVAATDSGNLTGTTDFVLTVGAIDIDTGLVGYWKFDDQSGQVAADSSGRGNDATLGVSTDPGSDDPDWVFGKVGGALSFDGTSDFVRVIDNPDFELPVYSYSMWLNGDSAPGTSFTSQPLSNADQQLVLSWDHTKSNFVTSGAHQSGSNFASAQISSTLSAFTWHHFAVTYDGGLIRIYLNGVLQDTVPSGPPNTSPGDLHIGAGVGPSVFFAGVIDEVRIYDRALNDVEIEEVFEHGTTSVPVDGLVAYWPFDDQAGQTVTDASGNGKDGTLGASANPESDDPIWVANGQVGGAVDFDGVNDHVRVLDDPDFQLPSYSYSMWINGDSVPGTSEITQTLSNGNQRFSYSWDHANPAYVTSGSHQSGAAFPKAQLNITPQAGVWYHITVTYDGTFLSIYLNGVLQEMVPAGGPVSTAGDLRIGSGFGPNLFFEGMIDEVRVYDRALTSDEAVAVYEFEGAVISNTPPDLDPIPDPQVDENDTLIVPLTATDPDVGDTLTLTSPNLPGFGSLVDNGDGTGSITFNPGSNDTGNYNITVNVIDSGNLTDSETFKLTVGPYDILTGLVAYWPFDDLSGQTAADFSGNGRDAILGATLSPGTDDPTWIAGQVNGALDFDGTNDHVRRINDSGLALPIYSYSLWVNGDSAPGTSDTTQVLSNANQRFSFSWDHIKPEFVTATTHQSGPVFPSSQLTTSLQADVWYHITATYDGTFIRIYLNGVLENTVEAGPPNNVSGDLTVGSGFGPNLFFDGSVDEVRIYDRVLNDGEVQALFEFEGAAPGNNAPVLNAIAEQQVDEEDTLVVPLSAFDFDAGDTLTLSSPDLPSFGNLVDNGDGTGSITFTPGLTDTGVYSITVVVTDSGDLTDDQAFNLIVGEFDLTTGLVAHWPFDDQEGQIASDHSGNGKDAIIGASIVPSIDDPTWVASGKVNGALSFDGSDDQVRRAPDPDFELPVYSYSMWVKGNNAPVTSKITQLISSANERFAFSWDHSNPGFVTAATHQSGSVFPKSQITTPLQGGVWYHITVTYDGANLKIYLNGALEDSVAAGPPNDISGLLVIGSAFGPHLFFGGMIDEVRIYNRALTNEEALALFQLDDLSTNQPPVLDSISDQQVDEQDTLIVPLSASDANAGDTLTLSSPGLPAFGSLVDNGDGTGSITFNPGSTDTGTYEITVEVTDSGNLVDTQTFRLTVGEFDLFSGLVAYWPFDDQAGQTAIDASGNGKNATLGASAASDADDPTWAAGQINGALDFDGSNDHVRLISDPDLKLPVYSFSMWVNGDNAPGTSEITQVISNTNQHFTFSWDHTNGAFVRAATHRSDSAFPVAQLTTQLQGGVWYHITVTYDGTSIRIYLNGVLEKTVAAGPPNLVAGDLTIGSGFGPSLFFEGLIDEVRVYDRALGDDEALALYTFDGTVSVNRRPNVDPISNQSMDIQTSLVVPISTTDPDTGDTITLSSSVLPSFGSLVDNGDGTGSITFNPGANDAGIYPVTVDAVDSGSLTDSEVFYLTVGPFDLATGLVGYWTFDESDGQVAVDASLSGHDGLLGFGSSSDSGDPTPVAGMVNGAFDFDGADDWVSMGDQIEYELQEYTYAWWVNGDTVPGPFTTSQMLSNANQQFSTSWSHLQSQYVTAATHDSGTNTHVYIPSQISTPLTPGVWYHITVTYDGSAIRIYLNGVLEDTSASGPPKAVPGGFQVGGGQLGPDTGPNSFFDGRIDEVRIYDRALSQTEIDDLVAFSG